MQGKSMGRTYEYFTLKNADDLSECRKGRIKESDIRQITVKFMIDTGADRIYIPESVQKKLGLTEIRTTISHAVDGRQVLSREAGPVEIYWHDRDDVFKVRIVPNLKEPIMGVLGLETLYLKVNPVTQCVEPETAYGGVGTIGYLTSEPDI
jgi:clan AA aspartic protease